MEREESSKITGIRRASCDIALSGVGMKGYKRARVARTVRMPKHVKAANKECSYYCRGRQG